MCSSKVYCSSKFSAFSANRLGAKTTLKNREQKVDWMSFLRIVVESLKGARKSS